MLEEIQALNYQATSLMESSEDPAGAMEILSYMSCKLSTCFVLPSSQPPLGSGTSLQFLLMSHRFSSSGYFPPGESILAKAAHSRRRPAVGQGDFWFIPFALEYTSSDDPVMAKHRMLEPFMQRDEHITCSVTTLFNMGLCYHLEWQKNDKRPSRYLLHALLHYRHAFAFLLEQLKHPQKPHNKLYNQSYLSSVASSSCCIPKSLFPVFMAICTNAAYCCQELGDIHQLPFWSQWLTALVKAGDSQWMEEEPQAYKFFAITAFHNGFGFHTAQAA